MNKLKWDLHIVNVGTTTDEEKGYTYTEILSSYCELEKAIERLELYDKYIGNERLQKYIDNDNTPLSEVLDVMKNQIDMLDDLLKGDVKE